MANGQPMSALASFQRDADHLDVAVSAFTGKTDTVPKPQRMAWPELVRRLTVHEERAQKDGKAWSPTIYEEGATRGNDGVAWVTMAVFDVDHAEPDWTLL